MTRRRDSRHVSTSSELSAVHKATISKCLFTQMKRRTSSDLPHCGPCCVHHSLCVLFLASTTTFIEMKMFQKSFVVAFATVTEMVSACNQFGPPSSWKKTTTTTIAMKESWLLFQVFLFFFKCSHFARLLSIFFFFNLGPNSGGPCRFASTLDHPFTTAAPPYPNRKSERENIQRIRVRVFCVLDVQILSPPKSISPLSLSLHLFNLLWQVVVVVARSLACDKKTWNDKAEEEWEEEEGKMCAIVSSLHLLLLQLTKRRKLGVWWVAVCLWLAFFFIFLFLFFGTGQKKIKRKKKKKMKRCVWLGAKICVNHLISDRHSVRLNNHPNHSSLLINLPDFVFFYVLVLIMLTALDPLNIDTLQFLPPPHF